MKRKKVEEEEEEEEDEEREEGAEEEEPQAKETKQMQGSSSSPSSYFARRLNDADDYRGKAVLAPMVRVGTLSFRLLALEQGADIVWSEEIIDKKIMKCHRRENEVLGQVEFIPDKGPPRPVFSTCAEDHPNVFQMGTADAVFALQAAQTVCRDVDGIDVNMGCPKHFSISGGMGAALLSKPETVKDILTTLKRNINNPITAKIRLLPTLAQTIDFMKMLEQCEVSAISLHARNAQERPKDAARWSDLKEIVQTLPLSVPIIGNGDIFTYQDIANFKNATGVSSVMIARGALRNPSIFSPHTRTREEMLKSYLTKSIECDNFFQNTKYTMLRMYTESERNALDCEDGQALVKAKTMRDTCKIWGLEQYYSQLQATRVAAGVEASNNEELDKERAQQPATSQVQVEPLLKRPKQIDEEEESVSF